jgi:tight adherence protein B
VRRVLALVVLAALCVPAAATAGVELRKPDFSAYPHAEALLVTSKPTSRPPVLRENGAPVADYTAQNLGRAKSVLLAIDTSRSMRGKALADAIRAARAFVAAKPAGDRIAIATFGDKAQLLTQFSSATIDADIALRELAVSARQGTALNDAIALGSETLGEEVLPGRVLIVLTDGNDQGSSDTEQDALAAAGNAGVVVYPVGIESDQFSPDALRRLAKETGGTYRAASSSAAVQAAYADIAAELRRTWVLGWVTDRLPGEAVGLKVAAAGAGTAALSATVPGEAGGSSSAAPSTLLPEAAYSSRLGSLAVGVAVGLLLLLAWALVSRARRGGWVQKRIAGHLTATRKRDRSGPRERFASGAALLRATEEAFGHLKHWRRVHALLERADLPLRTVEFLYIATGSAIVVGLLAALAAQSSLVILLAFAIGALVPFGVAWFKAKRRSKAFEDQLPDVLLTMAASLKAGHSFKSALQTIVDEGAEPASKEFNRVLTETRLGRPMEVALADLPPRVGSKNLEFVITAVTIQGSVGGSLAGLFDMVADTVRNRQQFARKIKGLTAMGRASAYVLVALPFVLAGALTLLNRTYMDPLWNTSTGHKMLLGMVVMIGLGSVMLKKIVSFKG